MTELGYKAIGGNGGRIPPEMLIPNIINVKRGKKNKREGAAFERLVRKDLESKGWILDRWSNQVELITTESEIIPNTSPVLERSIKFIGKLVPAKSFMGRTRTNGFPDYLCFRLPLKNLALKNLKQEYVDAYEVIGIECKSKGYLSKIEKEKCKWYLDNKTFSKILIASKSKKEKGKIIYKEFK